MSDSTKPQEPVPTTSDATEDGPGQEQGINRARRRLLALGVYVPPTILGIIALQQAGCQPNPSCQPAQCQPNTEPCQPDENPCGPNEGCQPDNCPPNN